MVNRPPPRSGSSISESGGDNSVRSKGSRRNNGLEWSLRSLRNIDNSAQHFLHNYYDDGEGSDSDDEEQLEDQTAYDIFKGKDEVADKENNSVWATLNAPLRTGVVDGKKVIFELLMDVTQKPEIPRSERIKASHKILNANKSDWEVRLRFWMMHFGVARLSVSFMGVFLVMNVFFAALFYSLDGRCCGDSSYTFGDVFAFTVQTSTTIGYGSSSPVGYVANFFVVILSYTSILVNTLFAGLLFTKFVTPIINIEISEVMTLCNVNGVPCLTFRLGNNDGTLNPLTDINVRLTYSYQIPYTDHNGEPNFFRQTEELRLLSNRQHGLVEVWTLRHVLDESSPLFGLNFNEHPGNKIYTFTLSIDAVQDLTKSSVNVQTQFGVQDIMIGHTFSNQVSIDPDTERVISDYSKMSDCEPYPVWYPARANAYGEQSSLATFDKKSSSSALDKMKLGP